MADSIVFNSWQSDIPNRTNRGLKMDALNAACKKLSADGNARWFIDTNSNGESLFVRLANFLGADDPYESLKTTLKAEIDEDAWESLNSDGSRHFPKPAAGKIAVKIINHLGDEVMKVFEVK